MQGQPDDSEEDDLNKLFSLPPSVLSLLLPGLLANTDCSPSLPVQGLPDDAEEADLYKLFEPVPGVVAVRVVRDRHTQLCRGFAYLVGGCQECRVCGCQRQCAP